MKLNLNLKNISLKRILELISKYYKEILLSLLVLLICNYQFHSCVQNKKINNLTLENKAVFLQLKTYRNSDSLHVAQIQVLTSENSKQFLKMRTQDSMIMKLQDVVKDYKNKLQKPGTSATVITSTTTVEGTMPTQVVQGTTPVAKESFPQYNSSRQTKWIDLAIQARRDSTSFQLKVRNEYSVVLGYEKRKPFAEVTNYNPYTETTDMRTYSVFVSPPKRISLGIHAGYGVVGTKFGPYIGIGLNYDLINIK